MALGWGKSCKIVGGYLLLAILSFLALSYFNPSKCPPANLFANLHYQIFASKVLERTLPHSTVHCYPLPGNAEVCRYTSLCIDRHSSIVLLNDHILKNIPFDDLSSPPHNNNNGHDTQHQQQQSRKRFPLPRPGKAKGYYVPSWRTTWSGLQKRWEEVWASKLFWWEPELKIHWLPGTTWMVAPEDPNSLNKELHASSYAGMAALIFLNESLRFDPKYKERIMKRFSVKYQPQIDTVVTSDWARERSGWYSDLIDLLIPKEAVIYWAEDLKGDGSADRSNSNGRKPPPPLPKQEGWDLLCAREGYMVSTVPTLFSGRAEADVVRKRAYDRFGLKMQNAANVQDRPAKVLIVDEPKSRAGGKFTFDNVSEIISLVERLKLQPIHVNDTEALSFKELVTLLHSAALTIWPHGWDGSTNMIFQQSGGAVLEVIPVDQLSNSLHAISKHLGLSYASLFAFEQDAQSDNEKQKKDRPLPSGVAHHSMIMEHQIVAALRSAERKIWVSEDFLAIFNASLPFRSIHAEVNITAAAV